MHGKPWVRVRWGSPVAGCGPLAARRAVPRKAGLCPAFGAWVGWRSGVGVLCSSLRSPVVRVPCSASRGPSCVRAPCIPCLALDPRALHPVPRPGSPRPASRASPWIPAPCILGCGLRAAGCGLRAAGCGAGRPMCGLRSPSPCGLASASAELTYRQETWRRVREGVRMQTIWLGGGGRPAVLRIGLGLWWLEGRRCKGEQGWFERGAGHARGAEVVGRRRWRGVWPLDAAAGEFQ